MWVNRWGLRPARLLWKGWWLRSEQRRCCIMLFASATTTLVVIRLGVPGSISEGPALSVVFAASPAFLRLTACILAGSS